MVADYKVWSRFTIQMLANEIWKNLKWRIHVGGRNFVNINRFFPILGNGAFMVADYRVLFRYTIQMLADEIWKHSKWRIQDGGWNFVNNNRFVSNCIFIVGDFESEVRFLNFIILRGGWSELKKSASLTPSDLYYYYFWKIQRNI